MIFIISENTSSDLFKYTNDTYLLYVYNNKKIDFKKLIIALNLLYLNQSNSTSNIEDILYLDYQLDYYNLFIFNQLKNMFPNLILFIKNKSL